CTIGSPIFSSAGISPSASTASALMRPEEYEMKRLWQLFAGVIILSFAVLSWIGTRIYQEMPPLPDKVVTTAGDVVIDSGEIQAGQNVWQSLGGMQVGSVWGHGSYVAPDWTADWLH